jgi:hypothetical protein
MSVSYGGDSIVFADGSVNASGFIGHRNRIINGAMVIDQRNAGASVTPASFSYTLDRWGAVQTTASKFSVQQNAASVTPPAGFTNYLGVTSLSAYSVGAGDTFNIYQSVEGFNCADFAWGTASAQSITLSFWVRSSLTGTFGGAIKDGSSSKAYPFTYTISSANTWEYETITIVGPTSGQFSYTSTTNGIGLQVMFGLGAGATFSGTAGAWNSTNSYTATGATSVVGTNGATFYITGVQLERGSTASSFEYRSYGAELALCQRYYEQWNVTNNAYLGNAFAYSTTGVRSVLQFQVPKRGSVTSAFSGSLNFSNTGKNATITSFSFDGNTSVNSVLIYNDSQTGFTTGQGLQMQVPGVTTATLTFSAEL